MKLQTIFSDRLKYSMEAIAQDQELSRQIQTLLIPLGLLDPPADGKFGPLSASALQKFQSLMKSTEVAYLGPETAKALIEAKLTDLPKPTLKPLNNLAGWIARYMLAKHYHLGMEAGEYNIVYLEGMNADGTENRDSPNEFNDRRLVIEIVEGIPTIVGNWEATTEPGSYYTYNPMNASGAARIKFGQYKAWQVGTHGNSDPHEALVQVGPVSVHRDFNQDFSRVGDFVDTGNHFGINQHYGYDYPRNDIYTASAGCLVGRTRQGHREFMQLIKQDRRYRTNPSYIFTTTIISGDELLKMAA
jgi:peptidoglycan hydrolase-like protein with peptidoglycan-binding domain